LRWCWLPQTGAVSDRPWPRPISGRLASRPDARSRRRCGPSMRDCYCLLSAEQSHALSSRTATGEGTPCALQSNDTF
jgi:hypothetical protein